jgi:hypothetical protein
LGLSAYGLWLVQLSYTQGNSHLLQSPPYLFYFLYSYRCYYFPIVMFFFLYLWGTNINELILKNVVCHIQVFKEVKKIE